MEGCATGHNPCLVISQPNQATMSSSVANHSQPVTVARKPTKERNKELPFDWIKSLKPCQETRDRVLTILGPHPQPKDDKEADGDIEYAYALVDPDGKEFDLTKLNRQQFRVLLSQFNVKSTCNSRKIVLQEQLAHFKHLSGALRESLKDAQVTIETKFTVSCEFLSNPYLNKDSRRGVPL